MAAASAAKFFAHGLPGSCSDDHLPIGAAWDRLFERAVDERAVPLLANAVDTGLVAATAEQERMLGAAHADLMASCVVLERAALELAEHYTRAGVEFRLLKGAAVAHLDYPDPSWRAFGDVDVLVTGAGYDAAIAVLEGLGGRRRSAEVRAGFDRRFGKGVCMLMPSGVQVDIHRTLATGPFGLTVDLDSLFSGSDSVTVGGRALPVLSREHRFLHACFHAALGDAEPRLVALRDVAQMLLMTDLDADRARDTAQHWRAGIVVVPSSRYWM